jgi:hypothetical protein
MKPEAQGPTSMEIDQAVIRDIRALVYRLENPDPHTTTHGVAKALKEFAGELRRIMPQIF